VAVVVGPDDLDEEELPATVVPAGEADVVGKVPLGDLDEVAWSAGEQCVGGAAELEAAAVEMGNDFLQGRATS